MTCSDTRQRGFALLIVLWTLALLALLGTQLLATGRQDTQLARNLLDAAVLEAAANGAVQQAIFGMLDGSNQHWSADGTRAHSANSGAPSSRCRSTTKPDKVNPNIASASATAGAAAAGRCRSRHGHYGCGIDRRVASGQRHRGPAERDRRPL